MYARGNRAVSPIVALSTIIHVALLLGCASAVGKCHSFAWPAPQKTQ